MRETNELVHLTINGEIISRKATDLDKIKEETFRGYLAEFKHKYAEGTVIRSNKYGSEKPDWPAPIDGQELKGEYILEIPLTNESLPNIDYFKSIAKEYTVTLRFTSE